ncbi:MAG: hypothetical protein DI548_14670 [Flavobacterium johnsoniae]|nr:MAG: hypothetical protein DI548_14670 [Flavobacterium johnsoniae]
MAYAALRHLKFSVLFNYRYIDFFLPDILINRTGNKKKKKKRHVIANGADRHHSLVPSRFFFHGRARQKFLLPPLSRRGPNGIVL